jgi:hypothetical protein
MQKPLKTKAAGAGAPQAEDTMPDAMRPMKDGPVMSAGEPEATPPDIIVEN